jgi:hypothetical protein
MFSATIITAAAPGTAPFDDMIARQSAQTSRSFGARQVSRFIGIRNSWLPPFLISSDTSARVKMRTLCVQNAPKKRGSDIFNDSASTTYNFNTQNCTHFPPFHLNLNLTHNHNLDLGRWLCFPPLRLIDFALSPGLDPKLTKTDRFRPNLPGAYYTHKLIYSYFNPNIIAKHPAPDASGASGASFGL